MEDRSGRIRVLLVDDHAILREGLASLIEKQDDITVVGEAEDGAASLQKAETLLPDVVVLDIKLADMSGIEVCRRLKESYPLVKVIMLSMYEDYEYVNRALRVGADGYLLKKVASAELVNAIRKARRGEKVFSPQVLDMIVSSFKEERGEVPDSSPLHALTSREREVLELMSEGMSNKEIGARLFISPKTVEKAVSNIFHKLGVNSRTAAVKIFLSGAGRGSP
ncbi:MAG: response regulator transcription factor [Actinobacteria bacterium]|nr:response regulator transcription factor [Actinomycetota bacterium]MDI6830641.1 response regulator transcription factor [Actinomycetota bacterium]